MTPVFERLAVIGLGLVGGSVALGARKREIAVEVRGVDPHRAEAGGIPLVSLEDAAEWADGLVLATPVEEIESVLEALAPRVAPEALLTDVASVKGPMASAVRRFLPAPERCIGAHPMAGGDASGFEHARPDLFEGAACILTPEGTEPAAVVDRIEQFWQCFGTFTVRRTPEEHDAICAALSHAPHAIAFAYAKGLPERETLRLAGRGLHDFTRIARSSPRLWSEILLMNAGRVTEEITRFQEDLENIRRALERADRAELEEALAEGQRRADRVER